MDLDKVFGVFLRQPVSKSAVIARFVGIAEQITNAEFFIRVGIPDRIKTGGHDIPEPGLEHSAAWRDVTIGVKVSALFDDGAIAFDAFK